MPTTGNRRSCFMVAILCWTYPVGVNPFLCHPSDQSSSFQWRASASGCGEMISPWRKRSSARAGGCGNAFMASLYPSPFAFQELVQYLPSPTSKWVGLFNDAPPCITQCAVQRFADSRGVGGGPSRLHAWAGLSSRARPDSLPANFTDLPISSANCGATARMESMSGPVRFSVNGGLAARPSARRMHSLASPCQMQLN